MNLLRQLRKAEIAALTALLAKEYDKADYIGWLMCHMRVEAEAGRPQPWSFYSPRVDEEFE